MVIAGAGIRTLQLREKLETGALQGLRDERAVSEVSRAGFGIMPKRFQLAPSFWEFNLYALALRHES